MALKKECPICHGRFSRKNRNCPRCKKPFPQNPVWWVEWKEAGKKKCKRIGPDRKVAELFELEIRRKKALWKAGLQKETITLRDFWPRYYIWAKQHNRSPETKLCRWKVHLEPFFGDIPMGEISKRLVEDYKLKRLQEGASNSTINKEIRLLHHILEMATEWEYLDRNPITRIRGLPEERKGKGRALSPQEFQKLLRYLSPTYVDLACFLAYTGARLGDALSLRWRDIDFEKGLIVIAGEKIGESYLVPMSESLKIMLCNRKNGAQPEDRVFQHSDSNFRRALQKAARQAGIGHLRIHDLRHTFITWLASNGIAPQIVAALAGHKDMKTTERYIHLSLDDMKKAISVLSTLLEN